MFQNDFREIPKSSRICESFRMRSRKIDGLIIISVLVSLPDTYMENICQNSVCSIDNAALFILLYRQFRKINQFQAEKIYD